MKVSKCDMPLKRWFGDLSLGDNNLGDRVRPEPRSHLWPRPLSLSPEQELTMFL